MPRYNLGEETVRVSEQKGLVEAFFVFVVNILSRFARVRELFFVPLRPFSIDCKSEIANRGSEIADHRSVISSLKQQI